MSQAQTKAPAAGTACSHCGGQMRFVSSEPHPVAPGVDQHTYGCTRCDFVQILTVPNPAPTAAA